eukprot:COSAG03_NODE_5128_length_1334_cov_1.848583_2_plen_172_part_00
MPGPPPEWTPPRPVLFSAAQLHELLAQPQASEQPEQAAGRRVLVLAVGANPRPPPDLNLYIPSSVPFPYTSSVYLSLCRSLPLCLSLSLSLSLSLRLSASPSVAVSLSLSASPSVAVSLCVAASLCLCRRHYRAVRGRCTYPPRPLRPDQPVCLCLSVSLCLSLCLSVSHH